MYFYYPNNDCLFGESMTPQVTVTWRMKGIFRAGNREEQLSVYDLVTAQPTTGGKTISFSVQICSK